jgi:hypothetical protein
MHNVSITTIQFGHNATSTVRWGVWDGECEMVRVETVTATR